MRKIKKLPENLAANYYQSCYTYTGYNFIDENGFKTPIFAHDFQKFTFVFDGGKPVFRLENENKEEKTTVYRDYVGEKKYFRAVVMIPAEKPNQYRVQRKTTFNQLFGKRKDNIESYVILGKTDGKNKGNYVCRTIIDAKHNKTEEFFFFKTMDEALGYVESQRQSIIQKFK